MYDNNHNQDTHHGPPNRSISNIKTRPTTTITRRARVIHNLKLTPNQLSRIVDCATMQELQRGLIHHNPRPPARCIRRGYIFLALEDGVFFRVDLGRGLQGHQVLEPVAAAASDGNAEVVVGVFFSGSGRGGGWVRNFAEALDDEVVSLSKKYIVNENNN